MKPPLLLFLLVFSPLAMAQLQPVDHAGLLRNLDQTTLTEGEQLYNSACSACHGIDGTASLPSARSFNADELKYGNDPYRMWQTLTYGKGMMGAQTWLTPEQRYAVIQYVREELIKPHNPSAYFDISEAYLESLPRDEAQTAEEVARAAAEGLQSAGQIWARSHPGNYGNALYTQLQDHTSAALTLDLEHDVHLSYDLLNMRLAAAWTGELDLSQTKFHAYRGEGKPFVSGETLTGLDTWQWVYPDSVKEHEAFRVPLSDDVLTYRGHYQDGEEVVLSYDIMGRNVLEWPTVQMSDAGLVLVHTLQIGPSETARKLYAGRLEAPAIPAGASGSYFSDGFLAIIRDSSRYVAAGVVGQIEGLQWDTDAQHRIVLHVPPSNDPITIRILRQRGTEDGFLRFARTVMHAADAADNLAGELRQRTTGGPARWDQTIVTQGVLSVPRTHYDPIYYEDEDHETPEKQVDLPDDYPYTVDDVTLPFSNPWNAWVRPTALDFMDDGRLVLATYMGDLWLADGIDQTLSEIRWQRIATGLFEPMGVQVIDDVIYVIARDRIVRLHDLNGNGATDFYESFYADRDVSDFFHAFAFGLQTDPDGNFYYAKSGQYTSNANPGDLVRVTSDGKGETLATGFRTPNGVTVSPEGQVFVSDNQGNWTPANEINLVEPGKFYGYVPNIATQGWSPDGIHLASDEEQCCASLDTVVVPDTFTEPMLWLPQEFDNSPGGGIWSDEAWGPLGDRFIHTSFGKGWLYYVMPQEVDGVTQAAAVALPFQFDAGIQRVRVNPVDQQIYVTGLTGWDDGFATRYGSLNRVRYTGGTGRLLTDAKVQSGEVELSFSFPVERSVAEDGSRYEALMWNYKWQRRYGSEDWSVKQPDQEGRDELTIDRVEVSDDGRTVVLHLPELQPADQLRLRIDIEAEDGAPFRESVYMTVHNIPTDP